jgi:hypothetical protein
MASILNVDNLKGVTTAGSISVTGEGNSTTTNLQQGLTKMFCTWNGTSTVAVIDSFNQSTLTDNGTGDYSNTIVNVMNNADYSAVVTSCTHTNTHGGWACTHRNGSSGAFVAPTTSVTRMNSFNDSSSSAADIARVELLIHGDLA